MKPFIMIDMLNTVAMIGAEPALLVLVAVLVLFGGSKIPELMRGIGQGVGELKKGMDDLNPKP